LDPILIVALVVVLTTAAVAVLALVYRRKSQTAGRETADIEAPISGDGLADRLSKPRGAMSSALASLFASAHLSQADWGELEDTLVAVDVGPMTASAIVEAVRLGKPETGEQARVLLERELIDALTGRDRSLHLDGSPAVMIVVGVNGTGKTTSIAKIAKGLVDSGTSVVLGAADTFRAAADAQLRTWGDRVGVRVVSGSHAADPASVAFDAYSQAKASGVDVVIIDTAGRLHSQANLMDELNKIVRILEREAGRVDEVLLVLDGTTGQNGLSQAEAFTEAIGVTGLVLTKLDGTSRGGITIAVERKLDTPVKFIGVGEGMDDLLPFDPVAFVEALIAR